MRFVRDENVFISEDGAIMVRAEGGDEMVAELAVCGPRDEGAMALSCYLAGGCAKYEGSESTVWIKGTMLEPMGAVPMWVRLEK